MNICDYVLRVNEIFYSIQGEGGRSGHPSIFIRLAGCNLRCPFCDTEFETYKEMTLAEIIAEISQYKCSEIVWTGGEPCLQLNDEITTYFKEVYKYSQAIETNGTLYIPIGIDYVTISPKQLNSGLSKVVNDWYSKKGVIDEIRVVYPGPVDIHGIYDALKYKVCKFYLSPEFVGDDRQSINMEYVSKTVEVCLKNPHFKLSVQLHKLISVK